MRAVFVKETYEQIGPEEYNQLNPYVEAIGMLNHKYGKVKTHRTSTTIANIGALQVPMLTVDYEVAE